MKNPTFQQLFNLAGKRALVTGAGRENGIGAAIAKGLADFGAEIILHDKAFESNRVCEQISAAGGVCTMIEQDFSKAGGGRQLINDVYQQFDKVDIVVLNASYQKVGPFNELTDNDVSQQIAINFQANFELLQAVLPRLKDQGWGRVVNIGSVNQRNPKSIVSAYAASKAATHNLIQSLARDYAPYQVLLNTVAPGLIDTYPENRAGDSQATASWDDYAEQLNWMKRAGQPQEVVGAALYLASPACSFMTGENIFITGGY
ncbi:SDR family oxidoreductase [Colwellia echini]|uniref:SDR family oxidoreductase n=2 Tax=Colwellia echini TaxID=1982103 RepID=A0ABY3MYN6_9GAMM|nr:SDR family oxidoreductase [Colwellia echini]